MNDRTIMIGRRIKMVRMVNGMTQATFAEHIGNLATSTVSAYEKGVIEVQDSTLEKIAEIGEITKEDLVNGGSRFDEVIGKNATRIEKKRMRDDTKYDISASSGEVGLLITKLNGFRDYIDNVTGKLIERDKEFSPFLLTDEEKSLLTAYRSLPQNKKVRILEDTREWAQALNK